MSGKSFPLTPVIEPLEAKIAPAGTVILSTAGGVLTITGDAADNGIAITDVPGSGFWTITDPLAGTSYILNGAAQAAPFNIPPQKAIIANLGDGNDQMNLQPSLTPSGLVLATLSVNLGGGNDTLNLGTSSARNLQVTGATTLNLGEGNDTLNMTQSATFGGAVKVLGGGGNDAVTFSGVSGEQVFLKGLNVDLGTGNDTFTVNVLRFSVAGGPLLVKNTGTDGGASTFSINSELALVTTPAVFSTKLANLTVNLGNSSADTLHFGSSLSVIGANGTDAVSVNSQLTAAGAVTFDLKNGTNAVTLATNGSLSARAFTQKGGAGADALQIQDGHDLFLGGALNVALGAGSNFFSTAGASTLLAGSMVMTGGAGTDTLALQGASANILGSLTTSLGGGSNITFVNTSASTFIGGNLTVNGLEGADAFVVNTPQFTLLGSLSVKLGNGTNNAVLQGAAAYIGGGVNYTGGADTDTLQSANTSLIINKTTVFKGGAGSNTVFLAPVTGSIGPVSYIGGANDDILALGHNDGTSTTRLSVNGAVNGSFGTGAMQLLITDSILHGPLNVKGAAKTGETEQVILNQSVLNGVVNLAFGAGNGDYFFEDVTVRGLFNLNTGAGDDTVRLDNNGGTTTLSHWFGSVKILTGAGSDTVLVGSNPAVANAGNFFYRDFLVDGGADADNFTQGNNTFLGANNQVNIP